MLKPNWFSLNGGMGSVGESKKFFASSALFRRNWKRGTPVRLLGVHASGFAGDPGQMDLLVDETHERWRQAMSAADRLRDLVGARIHARDALADDRAQ